MQDPISRPAFVLTLALAATALHGAAPGMPASARACDAGPLTFSGVVTSSEVVVHELHDAEGGEQAYPEMVYKRTITYQTPDGPRTLISYSTHCPRSTGIMLGAHVEVTFDHRGQLLSLRGEHARLPTESLSAPPWA